VDFSKVLKFWPIICSDQTRGPKLPIKDDGAKHKLLRGLQAELAILNRASIRSKKNNNPKKDQ
jgi:hypothetical protein